MYFFPILRTLSNLVNELEFVENRLFVSTNFGACGRESYQKNLIEPAMGKANALLECVSCNKLR